MKKRRKKKNLPRFTTNAVISSAGQWTRVRPNCHPEAGWRITHSTFNNRYSIECNECGTQHACIDSASTVLGKVQP